MSKYNEKLATQSFVKNSISNLMKTINNPDEAIEAGIYKVIDDDTIAQFDAYILIVQVKPDDSYPIRQTKLTSDGMTYSRGFNQFEPPFPEFTQSTVSQNDMVVFKLMVDNQFATIEDELEKQRIIPSVVGESIVLPDSADAQLRGLKVMGKTEQFTTTGAQLIKYPFAYSNGFEKNGITYTYADSVLSVSGTSTDAGSWFDFNKGVQLPAGDYTLSYVADSEADKRGAKFYVRDADANVVLTELNMGTTTKQKTFTLTEDKSNIRIYMTVTGTVTLKGQIKLQLQSGKTATQFEPYTGGIPAPNVNYPQPLESIGEDGSVDVNVYGKNLFGDVRLSAGDLKTQSSVPTTTNAYGTTINSVTYDGKIVVSQANVGNQTNVNSYTNGFFRMEIGRDYFIYGRTYTFIADIKVIANPLNISLTKGNIRIMTSSGETGTFGSLSNGKMIVKFVNAQSSKYPYDNSIEIRCAGMSFELTNIMLVEGDVTANLPNYEPFKPIQTLTIPTPNGLPGVPVESGGNYTDASGQQWACDEVDFDRGVYVQRIYKYEVTGLEKWKQHSELTVGGCWRYDCSVEIPINIGQNSKIDLCMCTHYKYKASMGSADEGVWVTNTTYGITPVVGLRIVSTLASLEELTQMLKDQHSAGTPITYQYILAEPTETPLSAEEIAAYKALHTYKPNTSIHNSENAHMAVDYVADTKNYVDNKIKKEVAELKALVLEV